MYLYVYIPDWVMIYESRSQVTRVQIGSLLLGASLLYLLYRRYSLRSTLTLLSSLSVDHSYLLWAIINSKKASGSYGTLQQGK